MKESGRKGKFNRDGVDGGLKLHSTSKIMFDMDVCNLDNKIKNCVIYIVFQRF